MGTTVETFFLRTEATCYFGTSAGLNIIKVHGVTLHNTVILILPAFGTSDFQNMA
jgi:hypothetical protein